MWVSLWMHNLSMFEKWKKQHFASHPPSLSSLKRPLGFHCVLRVTLVFKDNCHYKHYKSLIEFLAMERQLLFQSCSYRSDWKKEKKGKKKPWAAPWQPWLVLIIGLFLITFYPKIQQEMWSVHQRPGGNTSDSCDNRCFLSNTFIHPFLFFLPINSYLQVQITSAFLLIEKNRSSLQNLPANKNMQGFFLSMLSAL